MSLLDKLEIRGVRSFGTDSNDQQKIEFLSPITLILGENGCGKTTIIECLKFALTGDLPPACDKGHGFVHDPNIFNLAESLGQVKLRVKNFSGHSITINRSMKLKIVKTAAKLKFEALDATVSAEKDGENISISKRCADANVEMANVMGVSKAIINNVLFCHQEESCWPLEKNTKLKERFDAIFGTTEYNKAIDKMVKYRKLYDQKAKDNAAQLNLLIHLKKDAEGKQLDHQNAQKKMGKLQDELDKCDENMKPLEERLIKIKTLELEISKLHNQKVELTTKLEKCKEHQESLLANIKTKFDGSIIDLNQEIRTFKQRINEKKSHLSNDEDDLQRTKQQQRDIEKLISELERKREKLIHDRKQEEHFHGERVKYIRDICVRLGITITIDLDNANESVDDLLTQIRDAFKQKEQTIKDLSQRHDQIDSDHQQTIDNVRVKQATVDSNIKSFRKQVDELKVEKTVNQANIDNNEQSAKELSRVNAEIEKVTKYFNEYDAKFNFEEDKKNITEKRAVCANLQDKLDQIDQNIQFLSSISKQTTEISLKEQQLESREGEMKKIKNKHTDNVKRLFNDQIIEANFHARTKRVYDNMNREIAEMNKKINETNKTISNLEMSKRTDRQELTRLETELQSTEDKIYENCRSVPLIEVTQRTKENVAKFQLDHGALKAADSLYKKYMQKIENNPCCPLCHKDMTGNEVTDLNTELLDEIRQLPESIVRTEKQLKSEQKKFESLLALQPLVERVEQLKISIPKLQQKLKDTEDKLSEATIIAESCEISLAEPVSNSELASSMLGDMTRLDEFLKEITRMQQDLTKLRSNLPENCTNTTLEAAQISRSEISTALKSERIEVDQLQQKYDEETEIMNKIREKRNRSKEKQIQLQERVQNLPELKVRRDEITKQIDKINLDLRGAEVQFRPLQIELERATRNKTKSKETNRKELNEATGEANAIKDIDGNIKRFSNGLQKLAELNLLQSIDNLNRSLATNNLNKQEKMSQIETMSRQIEQLQKDITGQDIIERDLKDNLDLKNLISEEQNLQEKMNAIKQDMFISDFKSISREKVSLMNDQDIIIKRRSTIIGQIGEVQGQIDRLTRELNQAKYRDAVKNYREMYYAVIVARTMAKDITKFNMALHTALMKFHTEKMNKINQLIKSLWHNIYRGNDIDYIQIRTDESTTNDLNKKRRVINYKVFQIKNDVELEMPGRCSAGQRVLASLIIRIALAQTFSTNCNVLALDEPTSNLDRCNIVSLCDALNKLVEERRNENFMLVVITHDEAFISALGRITEYYRVMRSDSGKSYIERKLA